MGRAASPMLHSRSQTAGATRSQFPFSTCLTVEGLLAASRVRRTALGSFGRCGALAALLLDVAPTRRGLRVLHSLGPYRQSRRGRLHACFTTRASTSFCEPLYFFFAPFALHRGRPLLHSPGRFAAANLSGTASSTGARQPAGTAGGRSPCTWPPRCWRSRRRRRLHNLSNKGGRGVRPPTRAYIPPQRVGPKVG